MDTNNDLYITKAELQVESSKITWDCIKIEKVSFINIYHSSIVCL